MIGRFLMTPFPEKHSSWFITFVKSGAPVSEMNSFTIFLIDFTDHHSSSSLLHPLQPLCCGSCGCSSVETSDSGVCCCFNHMAAYSPPMASSSSCLQTESSQTQDTVNRQTTCRKVYKRNSNTRKFHLSVFL